MCCIAMICIIIIVLVRPCPRSFSTLTGLLELDRLFHAYIISQGPQSGDPITHYFTLKHDYQPIYPAEGILYY